MPNDADPTRQTVSRARFERERRARQEAEALLEAHSRELYEANRRLRQQTAQLEEAVRQRTADLEEARIEADTANQAKSRFLAHMSHEIRTPMNGVLGMAAELRDAGLTAPQLDMLSVIIESGDLLLSVINDVLDLSKIEAGQVTLESLPCNLAEIVASADRLFALRADEKGLNFGVPVIDDLWIESDPTRLRQILCNLLSNAIKFTQRGGVWLSVEFRPHVDDGQPGEVHFVVEDAGIGMTSDQIGRVFTPYAQADAAITRTHGGSGLGLAISRQFCRMMGGDLTAESEAGRGSRFRAWVSAVPIAPRPAERPTDAVDDDFAWRVRQRPLDILAAEDNRANQLVLTRMLERFGLQPRLVGNGRTLIDAWRARRPDVILMDVQMPEMNGTEATRIIRQAEQTRGTARTPIIALSANVMTHHLNEYAACGMDASVPKPIRRATLIETILSVLPGWPEGVPASRDRRGPEADG